MPPEYSKLKKYDGCQGTVWQMGILLVDMLSPAVPAFQHPRHALRMAPRVPQHLSPGILFHSHLIDRKLLYFGINTLTVFFKRTPFILIKCVVGCLVPAFPQAFAVSYNVTALFIRDL